MNTYNFIAYLIYLPIVIALTWYVAFVLFRNARVFMLDIFNGRTEIALATNKLFETGFYLLNIGFALKIMEISETLLNGRLLLEVLSSKIGGFAIYLGVMLFLNLFLFFRGKHVARSRRNPVAAQTLPA
jgi:hypothetical protein